LTFLWIIGFGCWVGEIEYFISRGTLTRSYPQIWISN
jgi:hypothetical protein